MPTIETINTPIKSNELNSGWANMLAHQLPILPPVDDFWQELPYVFDWLYGKNITLADHSIHQQLSDDDIDYSWQPPSMIQAWHMNIPVELIRYAGANQLCLEIEYKNKMYLIEPYNLQKTLTGNIVLKAIEQNTNELKSFRLDWIQKLHVIKIPFNPQYTISLTPFIHASIQSEKSSNHPLLRVTASQKITSKYNYTIQCPVCNRKFNRQKLDTKLNAHENTYGVPCSGRKGYIVE